MKYEIVVGLEVHAELNTKTKIYCGCKNSFGSMVNSNCCPICTGMPGTLPTLNKSVVDYAVRMGYALHCSINNICKMDRKNYFYPDLPKAYQISQFDIPLCENGYIDAIVDEEGHTKRIGVTRIHIEEDAGKLIHSDDLRAAWWTLTAAAFRLSRSFPSRICAPPPRQRRIWILLKQLCSTLVSPTARCRRVLSAVMSMYRCGRRARRNLVPVWR